MTRFVVIGILCLASSAVGEVTIERIGGAAPAPQAESGASRVTVGSGVYLLHAIASGLARDTRIESRFHSLHDGVNWDGFEAWCREQRPPLTAVLGMGAAFAGDESAARARAVDIRTIAIDASRPLDGKGAGVALIAKGAETTPSLSLDYRFAFSLENLSRMTEIVAADLGRLAPGDAATIARNLDAMKGDLNALARLAAAEGAKAARTEVADPANMFPYLIQSLGLTKVTAGAPGVPALAALQAAGIPLHLLDASHPLHDAPWANVVAQYRENISAIFAALRQP
jgi:hypothetical protein